MSYPLKIFIRIKPSRTSRGRVSRAWNHEVDCRWYPYKSELGGWTSCRANLPFLISQAIFTA
jgi:hypothetical protein